MSEVIVVFKDAVPSEKVDQYAQEIVAGGGEIKERYELLNGFSATVKPGQLQSFQASTDIKYIEGDQTVSIQPIQPK